MKNEYIKQIKIGYSNIDKNLNLRLVDFADMVEDNVTELFEQIGSDNIRVKNKNNSVWMLIKMKIQFFKYPKWIDNVYLKSSITEKSKIKLETDTIMKDINNKALIVARQESCPIDLETRKIRKIDSIEFPQDIELKEPIEIDDFKKIHEEFDKKDLIQRRIICANDIDYSEHTNNISYIRYIMDTLDLNFFDNNIIKDFEIYYLHESKEGEAIDIYRKINNNEMIYLLKKDDSDIIRARISYIKNK